MHCRFTRQPVRMESARDGMAGTYSPAGMDRCRAVVPLP